jgi:hypothetical protein
VSSSDTEYFPGTGIFATSFQVHRNDSSRTHLGHRWIIVRGIDQVSGVFMRHKLSVKRCEALKVTSDHSPHGWLAGEHGGVVGDEGNLALLYFFTNEGVFSVG